MDGGSQEKLFMGEQGHVKYLTISERSKENKKLREENLCLEMIYGSVDEGWHPEVNVQGADGNYQNLGKDIKKDGEKHCQLMVEIYGSVMNHIDLMNHLSLSPAPPLPFLSMSLHY